MLESTINNNIVHTFPSIHFMSRVVGQPLKFSSSKFMSLLDVHLSPTRYNKKQYINERSIGTFQTGWHFVSNMRSWLPNSVGGVFWFGVDDASFSVHIPFYAKADVPNALQTGTGSVNDFSFDSMFWLNNLVAQRAYSQWTIIAPLIKKEVDNFETQFLADQSAEEVEALGSGDAAKFLSERSRIKTESVMKAWLMLWGHLTVTYRWDRCYRELREGFARVGMKKNFSRDGVKVLSALA